MSMFLTFFVFFDILKTKRSFIALSNTVHDNQHFKKIALFFFAYRSFNEKPDIIAEKYNIQRVHHRLLFFIGNLPGLSINELLTLLEVTKQAVNGPLRQLKDKKYIITDTDESDKRIKRLFLTESGKQLLDELTEVQIEQMESIFNQLGKEHEDSWIKVMEAYAVERPNSKYFFDSL